MDLPWCNGAELCNTADFSKLPVKNVLVQLVLKDFFIINWILWKEKDCLIMISLWIEQENMTKRISKNLFVR